MTETQVWNSWTATNAGKKVSIVIEVSGDAGEAASNYGKVVYAKSLKQGRRTWSEVEAWLKKQRLWTATHTQQYQALQDAVTADQRLLWTAKLSAAERRTIQARIDERQAKTCRLMRAVLPFFEKTADALRSQAQLAHLVSRCTRDAATGKPIFSSVGDFLDQAAEGNPIARRATLAISELLFDRDLPLGTDGLPIASIYLAKQID